MIAKRDADVDESDRLSPALARGSSKPIVAGTIDVEVAVHVLPGGGVIAPNGTCAVTLSFTPDAPGSPYGYEKMFDGTIAVVVAGGGGPGAETTRELRARCWADGSFVCGGDDGEGDDGDGDHFSKDRVLPPAVNAVGLRTGLREPRPRAPYESIELTLPGPIRPGDTSSASLHVGSVKNADGGGSNAEYAFASFDENDDVAKGWRVDEPAGSVAAGIGRR